jgi:hypothetical protein
LVDDNVQVHGMRCIDDKDRLALMGQINIARMMRFSVPGHEPWNATYSHCYVRAGAEYSTAMTFDAMVQPVRLLNVDRPEGQ